MPCNYPPSTQPAGAAPITLETGRSRRRNLSAPAVVGLKLLHRPSPRSLSSPADDCAPFCHAATRPSLRVLWDAVAVDGLLRALQTSNGQGFCPWKKRRIARLAAVKLSAVGTTLPAAPPPARPAVRLGKQKRYRTTRVHLFPLRRRLLRLQFHGLRISLSLRFEKLSNQVAEDPTFSRSAASCASSSASCAAMRCRCSASVPRSAAGAELSLALLPPLCICSVKRGVAVARFTQYPMPPAAAALPLHTRLEDEHD